MFSKNDLNTRTIPSEQTNSSDSRAQQGTRGLQPREAVAPATLGSAAAFARLGLIPEICRALATEGYENPTEIQERSIPDLLKGRDLLGCAQTGTGKTASFALPVLQLLNTSGRPSSASPRGMGQKPRALVLAPTRELAIQVKESFDTYGGHLKLKTGVILGGVGMDSQIKMLRQGLDILVATPGRFLDLQAQKALFVDKIEILILDEADRMLDMGFLHDVKKIIRSLPEKRQNLLFSATMPDEIERLALSILRNPLKVSVNPVSSVNTTIDQSVYFVKQSAKKSLLLHLLNNLDMPRTLVFTRTKSTANRVSKFLMQHGVTAEAIHGNKSQNARQNALNNFKSGSAKVLVASDLAARGLDVEGITHVVNLDLPNVYETYVHRIGRTGRAQATGQAIAFCSSEERAWLKGIEKLIAQKIRVISDHPFQAPAKTDDLHVESRDPLSGTSARGRVPTSQHRGQRSGTERHRPQQEKRSSHGQRSGSRPNPVKSEGGASEAPKVQGNSPRAARLGQQPVPGRSPARRRNRSSRPRTESP